MLAQAILAQGYSARSIPGGGEERAKIDHGQFRGGGRGVGGSEGERGGGEEGAGRARGVGGDR
jgi:hypothetical protein